MSTEPIKMSLNAIRVELSATELVRSDNMRLYLELIKADIQGRDTGPALAALTAVPLEQRYVWRVVSALKRGLCDLETESVAADLATLTDQELERRRATGIKSDAIFPLHQSARRRDGDKRDHVEGTRLPGRLMVAEPVPCS